MIDRRPQQNRSWRDEIKLAWQALLQDILNPYRPELHYMRGPGPKCVAAAARSPTATGHLSNPA
jgi:hypothetical protein